jgi:hypothetical protein
MSYGFHLGLIRNLVVKLMEAVGVKRGRFGDNWGQTIPLWFRTTLFGTGLSLFVQSDYGLAQKRSFQMLFLMIQIAIDTLI